MSTPSYQYIQTNDWMQPHNPYQLVNSNGTNQHSAAYTHTSSDPPCGYEQAQSFHPQYQHYDDAGYAAHPVIQQTHSPQPDLRHRRQNSTSTNGSYNSFKSPYPNANQPPYSAAIDHNYIDTSYDVYHSNTQYQKHLPTPSRTPTQEVLMDGQRGYDRRSGGPLLGQRYSKDDGSNTPRTTNGDQEDYAGGHAQSHKRLPTFDRTYSAIVQDELYDPNALRQSHQPAQQSQSNKHLAPGPYRNMVADRVQAANEARVGRAPIGRISREPSPFRQNSPYAGSGPSFAPIVGSAAGQRQQQKAESDAMAYHRHHQPPDESQPKTITPKDAVLDYHEQSEDGLVNPPLFPQSSATSDGSNYDGHRNYGPPPGSRQHHPYPQYQPPASTFNFTAPSMPASTHPSSQMDYRFAPQQQYKAETSEDSQEQPDYPAHLISMDTSKSEQEGESHDSDVERPASTAADGGTYTCTYHGCLQRFPTPSLLQKHKREGHRASVSDPSTQPPSPGGSTTPRNSQAGPHRCDRINPSTGKPCSTVFSRPYDLTRHEDTIHAQRTKVRCQYCTEEKTFSRNDALTRHMRVVHPNIDFPGKHRRRPTDP